MPRRIRQSPDRKPHFIKQWREKIGLTQEQLANRLEMSAATLSRIENGKLPYTQDVLEAIADALGMDVASLLIRDPSDPNGVWSIVDNLLQAPPRKQREIVAVTQTLLKTGS